jgi:hypothetical protein
LARTAFWLIGALTLAAIRMLLTVAAEKAWGRPLMTKILALTPDRVTAEAVPFR